MYKLTIVLKIWLDFWVNTPRTSPTVDPLLQDIYKYIYVCVCVSKPTVVLEHGLILGDYFPPVMYYGTLVNNAQTRFLNVVCKSCVHRF